MRTFIAVPLPKECREMLERIQAKLRASEADVRWVSASSIHLTLKFLGEIDPELVPRLADSLRSATDVPAGFTLNVRGVGAFPNPRSPRVVWCGIEGEVQQLERIQTCVEHACSALGFAAEERPFLPHLTLGRVQGKRNLQRLSDCIRIGSELECNFKVDLYNVYKSTLSPRGAIYDVLETIRLRP